MPDGSDWKEKRQYVRVGVSFPVRFSVRSPLDARVEFGEQYAAAVADDLSEGGIALLCNYPVPEGAVLSIRFSLFNLMLSPAPRDFDLSGDVRYRETKERQYRVGVRFINVPDDERRRLSEYVKLAQSRSDF